jgi:hypothetical protein
VADGESELEGAEPPNSAPGQRLPPATERIANGPPRPQDRWVPRPVRLLIAIGCGVGASLALRGMNGGNYIFGVAAGTTFLVSFVLRATFPEKKVGPPV